MTKSNQPITQKRICRIEGCNKLGKDMKGKPPFGIICSSHKFFVKQQNARIKFFGLKTKYE